MSQTPSLQETSTGDESPPVGPFLTQVLTCDQLDATPLRLCLQHVDRVVVRRGAQHDVSTERSGKHTVATLSVPDRTMSDPHFTVRQSRMSWLLEDLGSKNGTLINGTRANRAVLRDGDIIEVSRTYFLFRRHSRGIAQDELVRRASDIAPAAHTLSPELQQTFAIIMRVAATGIPILVRGETGTGKELTAQLIHDHSRRSGRFVGINCGAIAPTLVESELFGARKGAFSGAGQGRRGLVEAAHGGTLFLDEIAELREPAQVALLRVLQEGEVLPVGATTPVAVDTRIIAATHEDLDAACERGTFRSDLLGRIAGFTAQLPPLRRRLDDLGWLMIRFLADSAAATKCTGISRRAFRLMLAYSWPRNIRELKSAVHAAAALCDTGEIRPEHLPAALTGSAPPSADRARAPGRGDTRKDELLARLTELGGNVTAVARAMNTSRSQVLRLIERYEIDVDALRRPGR